MSANLNIVDLLKRRQPRQPWDERLPSGDLPFNPFRGLGTPNTMEQRTGESEGMVPPRQPMSPAIQRAGLGVPNRDVVDLLKGPAIPAIGAPPGPNEGRRVNGDMPPISVGTSTGGMNPLDKQQAMVDLMRGTPAGQKVRQHGDQIDVEPPEQSPSRVKNALVGLLLGTAQGGLSGGIAGAGLGAVKPEAIQQMLKDKHIAREENQLGRQLDMEGARADIDYRKAQAEKARQRQPPHTDERVLRDGEYPDLPGGTIINRTWNPEKGVWEDEVLNGRPVIAKSSTPPRTTAPHYIERDDGVYRVDAQNPEGVKLKGVPGKPDGGLTPYKKKEREEKR